MNSIVEEDIKQLKTRVAQLKVIITNAALAAEEGTLWATAHDVVALEEEILEKRLLLIRERRLRVSRLEERVKNQNCPVPVKVARNDDGPEQI